MKLTQKVTFSETIFAQEVDGEMVLLDTASENYFGLDEVGTMIWHEIESHQGKLQEVFEALFAHYEVAEEVLKRDLFLFLEKLEENHLVKVVSL